MTARTGGPRPSRDDLLAAADGTVAPVIAPGTPRLFAPAEQRELLALGLGVTNVVERATATAAELTRAELRDGGRDTSGLNAHHTPADLARLFAELRTAVP